jgi:hypothetical protein
VAQRDLAGGIDSVVADPVVNVAVGVGGHGFGAGLVDGCWGGPVWE